MENSNGQPHQETNYIEAVGTNGPTAPLYEYNQHQQHLSPPLSNIYPAVHTGVPATTGVPVIAGGTVVPKYHNENQKEYFNSDYISMLKNGLILGFTVGTAVWYGGRSNNALLTSTSPSRSSSVLAVSYKELIVSFAKTVLPVVGLGGLVANSAYYVKKGEDSVVKVCLIVINGMILHSYTSDKITIINKN
jgi:hypothetical protein